MYGHEIVVRLLVERDDVDTDDIDIVLKEILGETPPWVAKAQYAAIVRLLNDRRDMQARNLVIAPAGLFAGDVVDGVTSRVNC